ncbi:uncharacterized protein PAC_09425 [Phialocephala subalpina]|uniref:Uncharacterized protein n=1 Tax=Phialocephala subalpina TaxID=576137 RepID=A0A1L7X3D2_9HELO|nr:uncharacterized protein PAC_09425 [Phialocephala subalpina]
MASTISKTPEKDSTPSTTLETIMEMSSGLSQFRPDHLRVGSIAVLVQNPKEESGAIVCTRNRHCNGKVFSFRSSSHPIVVLATNKVNGSSEQKEEICLVARITSHGNSALGSFLGSHKETCTKPSIPILHDTLHSSIDMLRLTCGQLNKQSYVMLNHTYEVPASMVKRYVTLPGSPRSGYPRCTSIRTGMTRSVRLQETSYYTLIQAFGLDPQPYQPELYLSNFFSLPPQLSQTPSIVLQPSKQRPNINNNENQSHRDTQSFTGTRSAPMAQPRTRAMSTPSTPHLRREPSLISFPALPHAPSPSRSPVHRSDYSRASSIYSSFSDESSPLLPPPVTYRTPGRTSMREQVEDWCAFLLLIILLVILWWLVGIALWMYFNWVR